MIKTILDLEVFNTSYALAMEIFRATRSFPKEEKYSLTDQIIKHYDQSQQISPKAGVREFTRMNSENTLYTVLDH